jgi:hypothetical protein
MTANRYKNIIIKYISCNMDLTEINNIYKRPTSIKRIYFKSSDRHFVDKLKYDASDVCRNELTDEYIKKVLKKFKEGFIYIRDNQIMGFILWEIKNNKDRHVEGVLQKPLSDYKYMYIYLICAKKTNSDFGYIMLDDAEKHCIKKGVILMTLQPLNMELELYYRKYGFLLNTGRPYSDDEVIYMSKPVTELLNIFNNITPNNRRKTRKASKRLITTEQARVLKNIIDKGDDLDKRLQESRNYLINMNESLNHK